MYGTSTKEKKALHVIMAETGTQYRIIIATVNYSLEYAFINTHYRKPSRALL